MRATKYATKLVSQYTKLYKILQITQLAFVKCIISIKVDKFSLITKKKYPLCSSIQTLVWHTLNSYLVISQNQFYGRGRPRHQSRLWDQNLLPAYSLWLLKHI
uniref:Uncharacterized protein n=1 Tax=Hyaloperonospora arabidopsidis (strain Emoy2) TaxID=559515 RepID=M4BK19_HYAAE